ncbi:hypothetical protein D3C85_1138220 [compost metagenome]
MVPGLGAGVDAEKSLVQGNDRARGLRERRQLFDVIDHPLGFVTADFLTAEDPPVVDVLVTQAPGVHVDKARVLRDEVHLMTTVAHGLKGADVLWHWLARIAHTEHRRRLGTLGLVDNNDAVMGKLVPLQRLGELVPLRLQLARVQAGNVVIVDRATFRPRLLVDFLDRVQRLAVARQTGANYQHD